MAQYGPKPFYNFSYTLISPPDHTLTVAGGSNVSVAFSNMSGSGWSFGVVLWNPKTNRHTPWHTVTSSNPSTVFTNMSAGEYQLVVHNGDFNTWSGELTIWYTS